MNAARVTDTPAFSLRPFVCPWWRWGYWHSDLAHALISQHMSRFVESSRQTQQVGPGERGGSRETEGRRTWQRAKQAHVLHQSLPSLLCWWPVWNILPAELGTQVLGVTLLSTALFSFTQNGPYLWTRRNTTLPPHLNWRPLACTNEAIPMAGLFAGV